MAEQLNLSPFAAVILLLCMTIHSPSAIAQEDKTVLATVNGFTITARHVDRDLSLTLGDIKLSPEQKVLAVKSSLDKLVKQRIVFEFFKHHKIAAGEQEVALELERLKSELGTVEKSISDYLAENNLKLDELKSELAWKISWSRYLDRKLTDQYLESHFNANKRKFDGTKLRVGHLLLKFPPNATVAQIVQLKRKSDSIANELATTSISFEQATATHSDAPTKNEGGEIGWIGIDGPMPTPFTQAAFELSLGEISKPVVTKFGIHIILCMEVAEGTLSWRDKITEVKASAARTYFDAIAEKHRPSIKFE